MAAFYEDLIIWQKAMDIAEKVYALTKTLPADEIYGLSSQMRRSAVSIPSNIAEGHARSGSHKEFKHFLTIAKGSLAELETQIILCIRVDLVSEKNVSDLLTMMHALRRMLCVFISKLSNT